MTEPTTTDQDQAPSEEATESDTMLSTLGAAFRSAGFRSDGSRDETEPPAEPSPSPEDPFTTATEPAASSALETAEESSDNLPAVEEGLPLEPEDDPVSPYDKPGKWFVVHTQSGYEKKVKQNLEARTASMNMEGRIHEVVIPLRDVPEFKNGKMQSHDYQKSQP